MSEVEITMQQAVDMRKDALKLASAIFPEADHEAVLKIAKKFEDYFRSGKTPS